MMIIVSEPLKKIACRRRYATKSTLVSLKHLFQQHHRNAMGIGRFPFVSFQFEPIGGFRPKEMSTLKSPSIFAENE
jgi:hypothetical protein